MLFNSFSFLAFFTVLVVIYYLIPHRFRWILLILASLYFYATFNLGYVLLLLVFSLIVYLAGLGVDASQSTSRRRLVLVVGTIASLTPLFVFKYFDFFAETIDTFLPFTPSPVGLSFYSFSCVSYLVDVYRGLLTAERHPGRLVLYVAFFPKLLAGPIERATAFLPQLLLPVRFDPEGVTQGLQLILWGLFKKVVIADRLAVYVDTAYQNPAFASPVDLVIATYFFAFQIYCDFSGYSDIAIGAARVLGFDLMENFRRPYLATSVPEFWGMNRWHISLTRWFRDYMYIPLGGSRVSKPRVYFNQMAVFLVSGLWHGANWTFVIWGGLNGLYQILTLMTTGIREKAAGIVRIPSAAGTFLSALLTFHLILISWVFFRAASISDALTVVSRVSASLPQLPALFASRAYSDDIILSVILIAVLLVIEAIDEKRQLWVSLRGQPVYVRWIAYYALIFSLIVLGQWGLRQFVYLQF
jgi:alginate O-acetyltransferase complex protein AlgI